MGASTGLGARHISSSCDMGWGDVPIAPNQAIQARIWDYEVAVEQTSRVDSGHAHFFSNPINDSTVNIVTSGGLPKTVILRRLRWNGRVPRIMHGPSAAIFSLLAGTGLLEGRAWSRTPGNGIVAVWWVRLAGVIAFDTFIA